MTDHLREGYEKWKQEGGVPKTRLEKFQEKPTRKLAIELKCIECMGGEETEGYRVEIRNCSSTLCPLMEFRPYK